MLTVFARKTWENIYGDVLPKIKCPIRLAIKSKLNTERRALKKYAHAVCNYFIHGEKLSYINVWLNTELNYSFVICSLNDFNVIIIKLFRLKVVNLKNWRLVEFVLHLGFRLG